jgi:Tryptophan-associated transmembrane protein (Trp_oprn_chp)
MIGRRGLATAVLACVGGSLLALFAGSRTWAVQVHLQSPPLPPLRVGETGMAELPWLSAVTLVALAGAGALLATRGRLRAVVGIVLLLSGLGVLSAGGYGLAGIAGVRVAWPLLCLPAGALVAGSGAVALRRGRTWPAMGARYERPAPVTEFGPEHDQVQRIGPSPSDVAMWDALDRGEDPSR